MLPHSTTSLSHKPRFLTPLRTNDSESIDPIAPTPTTAILLSVIAVENEPRPKYISELMVIGISRNNDRATTFSSCIISTPRLTATSCFFADALFVCKRNHVICFSNRMPKKKLDNSYG